jgi:hypothetical protein
MPSEASAPITAHPVTLASRIRVSPEVMLQEVGGESVLLDLASENYFGLNTVGTRIWRLLDQDADVRRAYDTMLTEYDVPATQLEQEMIALLGQLAEAGLVTVE